ncbi:MAG: HEPN domain-containing protein [Nitrososphaeria archaeon]|mgnify:CR=1 FL=1|nr:HEPN domain-containing protein [Conexivisphaerales archaeon]
MSFEAAELLRKRAHEFLEEAERLLENGKFDLCVFNLEQYCQLITKYQLFRLIGSFPHTHSLKLLLNELSKHMQSVKDLLSEKNIIYIGALEDAYIASRYLPRDYEEAEARELLRFVKEVFRPAVEP